MKAVSLAVLLLLMMTTGAGADRSAPDSTETLAFGRFGTVTLYYPGPQPSHVVLFVSGDGGWNLGVVDMARTLAALDALVVGIDITHYLRELEAASDNCSYPAADFEALAKFVEKRLDFPRYIHPVLVGYSSGATLVYATLVQAPATTFQGAVSLGFCPDLPLAKPLCRGSGLEWGPGPKGKGVSFRPARALEVPWVVLQGDVDQVCDPAGTAAFVEQVKTGKLVELAKVGHGFSVERNWLPQFKQAFEEITAQHAARQPAPVDELKDLPLVEVPAAGAAGGPGSRTMAVIITGDGGYGVTDRGLAEDLAAKGIPTVALNSLHYFWNRRTPDETGRDLERILRHYAAVWGIEEVILAGYSMGADVLPFMVTRLPDDWRARVREIALLGPSEDVDFEFHVTDWLGDFKRKSSLPTRPEVEKLQGMKVFCFYGDEEKDTLCTHLEPGLATVVPLHGGHRIGGRYEGIADSLLAEAR